jgi:putative transposase
LREVELILAAQGIAVSYEAIREWSLRFGRAYAKTPKQRRLQPGGNCCINLGSLEDGG